MVTVSIFIERGNRRPGTKCGFVFEDENPKGYKEVNDLRGTLRSMNNLKRQLEGLFLLLRYVDRKKMYDVIIRARSSIVRDAIDHCKRLCEFSDLHRISPEAQALLKRIETIHNKLDHVEVLFVVGRDTGVRRAQLLARAPIVYTDGACPKNGQHGAKAGAATYWGENHPWNKMISVRGKTTNNTAEYTGHIEALKTAVENNLPALVIRTDSELMINTMYEWIKGWKKNNWRTAQRKPVENVEMIKMIEHLMGQLQYFKFEWVKGHATDKGNIAVDKMAKAAANLA